MATPPSKANGRHGKPPGVLRWIPLLLISLLLHLLAIDWAGGHLSLPSWRQPEQTVITTALYRPAPPSVPAPAPPPPHASAPKKQRPPHPRPHRRAPPLPPAPAAPAVDAQTAQTAQVAEPPPAGPAGMEAPGTSAEPAAEAQAAQAAEPAADVLSEAVADAAKHEEEQFRYKVDPPPSAELDYDVQALREGQTVYGHGKISWQTAGGDYIVNGEAGVLFFTLLNFRSEGTIDDYGVAPVLYSEKRFRRSETNTHFHRQRNIISFSASTTTYPRRGGEQDRASIVWQLTGIGRGDSERFAPGADIDIFVAGVRDGEMWRIHVIGEEEIEVGTGKLVAWHVVRSPRPGSYDQKIDIWLAPAHEWYPVRLRYTETNGDYLDMSLSKLSPVTSR